ncbi:MAG: HD-GYP domain-containing protein [Bacilli bacterium]
MDKIIFKNSDFKKYNEEMHPLYGYNMIEKNNILSNSTKTAILQHHVNEDGTGFPIINNLPIHEFSKIIHIADAYDKERIKSNNLDALEYLMANCGTLFSEKHVNIFKKYVNLYPLGTTVDLSDGRLGIVIKQTDKFPTRPVIRTITGNIEIIDLSNSNYNILITGINTDEEFIQNLNTRKLK